MTYRRSQSTASARQDVLAQEKQEIRNLSSMKALKPERLVAIAENAGKTFSEQVNTSQIRKIHEHIIRHVTHSRTEKGTSAQEIHLLKYHLAYAASRNRKMTEFAEFFSPVLDKITDFEDLLRFRQLYDAVLAYHKFFGGK